MISGKMAPFVRAMLERDYTFYKSDEELREGAMWSELCLVLGWQGFLSEQPRMNVFAD